MKGTILTIAGFAGIMVTCYLILDSFGQAQSLPADGVLFVLSAFLFLKGIRGVKGQAPGGVRHPNGPRQAR